MLRHSFRILFDNAYCFMAGVFVMHDFTRPSFLPSFLLQFQSVYRIYSLEKNIVYIRIASPRNVLFYPLTLFHSWEPASIGVNAKLINVYFYAFSTNQERRLRWRNQPPSRAMNTIKTSEHLEDGQKIYQAKYGAEGETNLLFYVRTAKSLSKTSFALKLLDPENYDWCFKKPSVGAYINLRSKIEVLLTSVPFFRVRKVSMKKFSS